MLSRYFAMQLLTCARAPLLFRAGLPSCHMPRPLSSPARLPSPTHPPAAPRIKKGAARRPALLLLPAAVEMRGLEPLTCALQRHRSPV